MKNWTLSLRIAFALVAYAMSFILLFYTPIYQNSVHILNSYVKTFIITNVIALVIIGIGYKRILVAVNIISMVFCAPSVLSHSKLVTQVFGSQPTQHFSMHITAFMFLIIVMLLLAARRLERLEKESKQMLSGGACEADVSLIWINSLKVYSAFFALVLLICISLIFLGFIAPHIIVSKQLLIIMVVMGITLIVGSVLFLYGKWVKKQ